MGRPPLPIGESRSMRTVTFLTPAERSALEKQAGVAEQTISAYCHKLIAAGLQDNTVSEKENH
ncbi:MAG: hypothetical protein ABJJ37_09170 [Roseibium sp.]